MKTFGFMAVGIGLLAASLVGAAALVDPTVAITEMQAKNGAALIELKFEHQPPKGGIVGGPQIYKVTKDTLKELKEETTVTVESDGTLKVELPKKK